MDIKLPGLNTGNIQFHVPGGDIHITGKWFNYGIIFIVMILDLNMWKNQIFYEPFVYGQYTDNEHYIYTVSDREFLANATKETLSYQWRWTNLNPISNKTYGLEDHKMNSRYYGVPLSIKGTAFIPSLLSFTLFGILVKFFSKGAPPTKVTPVQGKETRVETDGARSSKNGETSTVGNASRISLSRQSLSSNKSEFVTNKTKHFDSFLSVDSSRAGAQSQCGNLDSDFGSSRDVLENARDVLPRSRDNLKKSRVNLGSSRESIGEGIEGSEQPITSRQAAWSTETPIIVLKPKKSIVRDSCVSEKANELSQDSNGDQYNDTMVQELVQELSSLNFDEGERQTKEEEPPKENTGISVIDDKVRPLSFGDLFRQDTVTSAGSRSQLSSATAAGDEEDDDRSEGKPVTPSRDNFLESKIKT